MSTQLMGTQATPLQRGASEREALACLPSRLLWLFSSLVAGTAVVDMLGAPTSSASIVFAGGAALGAACEALGDLVCRRKLNYESVGPLFSAAKVLSSMNAAATLGVMALIFGDAAFQEVPSVLAGALGLGAGLIAASRGRVPTTTIQAADDKAPPKRNFSEADLRLAALHEAGHALSLAMIPKTWRVGSYVQIGDPSATFTAVPSSDSLWQLAVFRRWEMLMLLAGPVATDRACGAAMEGGASDMREWRHKAMAVLTAERAEGWTLEPADELEYAANQRLLKAMERAQTAALNEFFNQNKHAYDELAAHILEHRGVDPLTLDLFLDPVKMGPKLEAALGF